MTKATAVFPIKVFLPSQIISFILFFNIIHSFGVLKLIITDEKPLIYMIKECKLIISRILYSYKELIKGEGESLNLNKLQQLKQKADHINVIIVGNVLYMLLLVIFILFQVVTSYMISTKFIHHYSYFLRHLYHNHYINKISHVVQIIIASY